MYSAGTWIEFLFGNEMSRHIYSWFALLSSSCSGIANTRVCQNSSTNMYGRYIFFCATPYVFRLPRAPGSLLRHSAYMFSTTPTKTKGLGGRGGHPEKYLYKSKHLCCGSITGALAHFFLDLAALRGKTQKFTRGLLPIFGTHCTPATPFFIFWARGLCPLLRQSACITVLICWEKVYTFLIMKLHVPTHSGSSPCYSLNP